MTNPTPEELKLVAESVGYEAKIARQNPSSPYTLVYVLRGNNLRADPVLNGHVYEPFTNAEQSMELLKMLLDEGWKLREDEDGYLLSIEVDMPAWEQDKILELAIFQAALAHIKGSTKAEGEG